MKLNTQGQGLETTKNIVFPQIRKIRAGSGGAFSLGFARFMMKFVQIATYYLEISGKCCTFAVI